MAVEYNGKEYYSEKQQLDLSCVGCAFNKISDDGTDWCGCEDYYMNNVCYPDRIIWKEKLVQNVDKTQEEPKFTVEQVLLAAGNYLREQPVFQDYDKIYVEALLGITEQLIKEDDPDYQLYLGLKAKYEA